MKTLTQELTEFCKENNIETGKVGYLLGLIMKHKANGSVDQIFEQASKLDDYEFSTRQHWKNDKNDYDSPSIGGFSDY